MRCRGKTRLLHGGVHLIWQRNQQELIVGGIGDDRQVRLGLNGYGELRRGVQREDSPNSLIEKMTMVTVLLKLFAVTRVPLTAL